MRQHKQRARHIPFIRPDALVFHSLQNQIYSYIHFVLFLLHIHLFICLFFDVFRCIYLFIHCSFSFSIYSVFMNSRLFRFFFHYLSFFLYFFISLFVYSFIHFFPSNCLSTCIHLNFHLNIRLFAMTAYLDAVYRSLCK